nr:MAG TPA: hypothetical protein [Siphoviridae sp. ctgbm9]
MMPLHICLNFFKCEYFLKIGIYSVIALVISYL